MADVSSSCRCNKLTVSCCAVALARGAVMGLGSKRGVLYSVCGQTCSLAVWEELGLHPITCNTALSTSPASALAVCSSKSWIATAHKDFKIRLWSTQCASSPAHLSTLPSLRQYLHNWTLQRRYFQSRRHGKKRAWMQHSDTISALAFSADHSRLYTASWDRTIKVWNLTHIRCEESFTAHHDSINTMVVGAQDGLLYTGSADKSIKVWSQRGARDNKKLGKHAMVVAMEGQGAAVNALVLTRKCMQLYSGGSDGRIVVWRRSSPCWPHVAAPGAQLMQVQEALQGHTRAVLCLDMHPDESLLVSGSADQTVRLWSCPASASKALYQHMTCVAVLKGHTAPVRSLTFKSAMDHDAGVSCAGVVYSGSLDGSIRMWMLSPDHEESEISSTQHTCSSTKPQLVDLLEK